MKYVAATACLLVAFDCISYAMSIKPQSIFAAGLEPLWWAPAIGWIFSAIGIVMFYQRRA